MTITALIDRVLELAYPRRFNQSLLELKKHLIYQGLTEIQRAIPSFCQDNVDIVSGSFDIAVSGASVFDAPDGDIVQVAIGTDGCKTMDATLVDHWKLQTMQKEFADAFDCGDASIKPLYPTSRAFWARDRNDLMVYPWVPDGWMIGVRWNGVKRNWANAFDLWWGDRAVEVLRRYVLSMDVVNCPEFGNAFGLYRNELAALRAEEFRKENPVQYTTYSRDVLFPVQCPTPNDTGSVAAIAS